MEEKKSKVIWWVVGILILLCLIGSSSENVDTKDAALQNEINSLNIQIEELKNEKDKLLEKYNESENIIENNISEKEKVLELENTISEKDIIIKGLENTVSDTRSRITEAEKEIEKLEKDLESKKDEIEDLGENVNTLKEEKSELEDKVTSLSSIKKSSSSSSSNSNSSSSTKTTTKQTTSTSSSSTTNSYTVYITKSGGKYHSGGCSYLRSSKIAIDKSSAISQGYGACSRCNP